MSEFFGGFAEIPTIILVSLVPVARLDANQANRNYRIHQGLVYSLDHRCHGGPSTSTHQNILCFQHQTFDIRVANAWRMSSGRRAAARLDRISVVSRAICTSRSWELARCRQNGGYLVSRECLLVSLELNTTAVFQHCSVLFGDCPGNRGLLAHTLG